MLFLSVVGVGAMLAAEVLLDEERVHGGVGVDGERDECHLGHLFHHHSVVDRIVGVFAPGERPMVLHQYAGGVDGVDVAFPDAVDDDDTGFFLVLCHLAFHHVVGAGYLIMEIVGVCGADVRD